MDGFGSDFSAGASGGKVDAGQIMEQVKVQIAVANAQELLQRMTDKCFKKCIGKPGSSLDNSEQKCIAMCMDRYMDAWNTVSRTYNSRITEGKSSHVNIPFVILPFLRLPACSEKDHTWKSEAVYRRVTAAAHHQLLSLYLTDRQSRACGL
ncbi:Mitochondrial import inner membrane translocase subunit Tim13-A [Nibea albiflora]|uniref:Mitochondrial import inner membrane translocase subunit Tim13-A n=1 Tax=Nibea albiflora TaxID=240163 RepID=A0ACB7ENC1_NIBAL|nr:Mitochondrial import inner membrane translocase subunit Tim13-A [Nibea albiflora]